MDTLSKQVPVDAPWTAAKAAEWDAKSVDNWIKENTSNPATANLLLSYLQPLVGADPREMSLLYLLWYIATAGDETNPGTFERSSDTSGAAQDSRMSAAPS